MSSPASHQTRPFQLSQAITTTRTARIDEHADAEHEERGDEVVEALERLLEIEPVIAEDHAAPDEQHDPRDGTEDREHDETPQRHARDTRGDRDERADDGKHAREED